jgi:hypothetical protein
MLMDGELFEQKVVLLAETHVFFKFLGIFSETQNSILLEQIQSHVSIIVVHGGQTHQHVYDSGFPRSIGAKQAYYITRVHIKFEILNVGPIRPWEGLGYRVDL